MDHLVFKGNLLRERQIIIYYNCYLPLNLDLNPLKSSLFIWFTGHFLQNIWNARLEKKQVQLFTIRADLEARASILSETRFLNEAVLIREMIQHCFQVLNMYYY
jgi:hypothetical protein